MSQMTSDTPPIRLPLRLRLLNFLGPLFRLLGLFEISAAADRYLSRARKQTGLCDTGNFDIHTSLAKLLYTLKYETGLHLFGRIAAGQLIKRNLVNVLQTEQEFKKTPALKKVDVDTPIIILCTPRTGSTLLHNLLSLHPDARAPRLWELHRPCPTPEPALERTDPRIALSDREFGMYYRLVPEMRAIHYFAPQAVEECIHLFNNIFTCRTSFTTMANMTSYTDWIMNLDMVPAYQEYRRNLQILKYHYQEKFLVLKSPAHLLCMEALAEIFPDAKIIHIHRDPATAAGSFCSLTEAVQISMRSHIDPLAIGETWNKIWTPAILQSMEWRKNGVLSIHDVNFRNLVASPIDTVTAIYDFAGQQVSDSFKNAIATYLQQHPKDEFGIHRYSLERYGLDRETLYSEYSDYISYFNIPLENSS